MTVDSLSCLAGITSASTTLHRFQTQPNNRRRDWVTFDNSLEDDAVKELIKQYLDNGISRRKLISGLTTIGMSAVAAKAMAQNLAPLAGAASGMVAQGASREMQGTGGALFVAQLKAAGIKYIFFNPSTGDSPIFDPLVDEPRIQLINGVP